MVAIASKLSGSYKMRKIKRHNRSIAGDVLLTLFLMLFGLFSLFPIVYIVVNAFKPLSEVFLFPPTLYVQNPTFNNFLDLKTIFEGFDIPLSRYIFNTLVIILLGTVGTVIFGSMAAFPLAKYKFPGSGIISNLIVYSLMFSASVVAIPNYLIMSKLHLVNTLWAVILPTIGSTLGLYLMKNFMVQIPDDIIEAAKIDGAKEITVFWRIVMPLCRPAWITLIILSFQALWGTTGGVFLYSENIKPLSYVLSQVVSSGISRTGVSSAIALILLIVPSIVFAISQSNVIETMATSGLKS